MSDISTTVPPEKSGPPSAPQAKPPDPVERPEKAGHYGILFIGIICFYFDSKSSRLVLLPDGRKPDEGIEPHYPLIVVDPKRIKNAPEWSAQERRTGVFRLPKCTLEFSGSAAGRNFVMNQHEANIPKLTAINPGIQVDPATRNAVVRCRLTAGTLEAFRFPGTEPTSGDAAVLSRLEVPHGGDVVITVTSEEWPEKSRVRRIVLQPQTEIALQNMSRQSAGGETEPRDHFILFARILTNISTNLQPQDTPINIPTLLSNHPVFLAGHPIGSDTNRCGNQGCCPSVTA